MKFLILLSGLMSLAASQHYFPHATIGHDGHPLETPEVQQAKSHHFAAHVSRGGHLAYHPHHNGHYNAHPVYTPEVASARQQHFHDYAMAAQRNGVQVPHYHPAAHHQYPVDTPEVQHAKMLHFAAHARARGLHYRRRRSTFGYGQNYEVPRISHQGVPLDTQEVEALKSKHFQAHNEALQRNGHVRSYQGANPSHYQGQYSSHQGVNPNYYNNQDFYNNGPYGASSNHLAFTSQPIHFYTGNVGAAGGYPVETPEVQAAKHAHFAAHARARGY